MRDTQIFFSINDNVKLRASHNPDTISFLLNDKNECNSFLCEGVIQTFLIALYKGYDLKETTIKYWGSDQYIVEIIDNKLTWYLFTPYDKDEFFITKYDLTHLDLKVLKNIIDMFNILLIDEVSK